MCRYMFIHDFHVALGRYVRSASRLGRIRLEFERVQSKR